jgi:hypothetical protein
MIVLRRRDHREERDCAFNWRRCGPERRHTHQTEDGAKEKHERNCSELNALSLSLTEAIEAKSFNALQCTSTVKRLDN